jgi:hypothetical protein
LRRQIDEKNFPPPAMAHFSPFFCLAQHPQFQVVKYVTMRS